MAKLFDIKSMLRNILGRNQTPPPVEDEAAGEAEPIETDRETKLTSANYIIELEKLRARFEGIEQFREAYNEKLANFSEKIGELRNALIEKEKDINEMKVAALRAVEMVKEVQPEKLMNLAQKQQVRIDTLKTVLESKEVLFERLAQEIKNMRTKLST